MSTGGSTLPEQPEPDDDPEEDLAPIAAPEITFDVDAIAEALKRPECARALARILLRHEQSLLTRSPR
jgi:hypothetical protein